PEKERVPLDQRHAEQLLLSVPLDTLEGLRDLLVLGLLLCTGMRDTELVAITVEDLRFKQNAYTDNGIQLPTPSDELPRFISLANQDWLLARIRHWLEVTEIDRGALLRGLTRFGTVRHLPLSTRAMLEITKKYPVKINDEDVVLRPLDLRMTYAAVLYQ